MKNNAKILALAVLLIFSVIGCGKNEEVRRIDLEKKEVIDLEQPPIEEKPGIRIAVGGMITPREGFVYYRKFLDYIGEKLGERVEYIDKEGYAEINMLLKEGKIDVAFVCGGPYVDGHNEFGMELLAAPQAYGSRVYYSYIIVNADSPITKFEELRGKTFAFTDPLSNTGKLVPVYMLAKINETPESFFAKYIYLGTHDKSIKAVAQNVVDGAAVDSLIWEYANRTNPAFTPKTKIISKSPPYGIPPVVVRRGLDAELKERIKQILLNADKDERGKDILGGMLIDKFVIIEDSAYDTIREMKNWLLQQSQK